MGPCGNFDILFSRNVPHILDIIFFSLDYKSFKTCMKVCIAWNDLLKSEVYKIKGKTFFHEEILKDEKRLLYASRLGYIKTVKKLLDTEMVDVNCVAGNHYQTPLCEAAYYGHKNIAMFLIDRGADLNKRGHQVGCGGYVLENGGGNSPIHCAAHWGRDDIVKLLLDKGAEPNLLGSVEGTPLSHAVARGRITVIQVLLDSGANPNLGSSTPLHWAAGDNNEHAARLLIEGGADPNNEDNDGERPLHIAAKYGAVDVARVLLDGGADPDCVEAQGLTPLHKAAKLGRKAVMQLLLDRGADPTKEDQDGNSVLETAVQQNNQSVVQLLLDRGAVGR